MLIDICVAFNEQISAHHSGCVQKPISLYDQVCKLINSIKQNWDRDKMDYRIYVFYSRPLEHEHLLFLQGECDGIIYDCVDMFSETADQNRIHAFKYNMLGDYTLYLGSDTIVLKTPSLRFDKEVYGGVDNNQLMSLKAHEWESLYEQLGLEFNVPSPQPMQDNATGKPFVAQGINADCILIKNTIKHDFYNALKEQDGLLYSYTKDRRALHFHMQINFSLAMKRFDYGYFPPGINYFRKKRGPILDMSEVEILHYLGGSYESDNDVKNVVDSY